MSIYNAYGAGDYTFYTPEWSGLKFTASTASTIGYTINGSLPNIDIYYSIDGKTWISWDGTSISLAQGDSIYVWNKSSTLSISSLNYLKFTMSGSIVASGNCNSMIDFSELSDYCYFNMFRDCTSLTIAPDLPATTLTRRCYLGMFFGCTSLVTAPDLPATTLDQDCYNSMFSSCTSLTSIKLYFTGMITYTTSFNYWVNNISTTGTLYYNGSDTTKGESACPTNWTIQSF